MAPDFPMHMQGSHVTGPLSVGISLEACAWITYRPFAKSTQVPKKDAHGLRTHLYKKKFISQAHQQVGECRTSFPPPSPLHIPRFYLVGSTAGPTTGGSQGPSSPLCGASPFKHRRAEAHASGSAAAPPPASSLRLFWSWEAPRARGYSYTHQDGETAQEGVTAQTVQTPSV